MKEGVGAVGGVGGTEKKIGVGGEGLEVSAGDQRGYTVD